jgi:chemotaxis response regulator CheB
LRLAGRDLIVLHVAPTGLSFLDEILTQAGPLPATQRVDGELITLGRIYVASHDHHLLLEPGTYVSRGDRRRIGFAPQLRPAPPRVVLHKSYWLVSASL